MLVIRGFRLCWQPSAQPRRCSGRAHFLSMPSCLEEDTWTCRKQINPLKRLLSGSTLVGSTIRPSTVAAEFRLFDTDVTSPQFLRRQKRGFARQVSADTEDVEELS